MYGVWFCLVFLTLASAFAVTNAVNRDGPVAIEVRFERCEDPLGIRDDGRRCDIFSDCDMRVRVQLDTESFNQSWPGAKEVSAWYMIDLPGDTNMVRLSKTLLARRSENEYHEDGDGNVLVNFRANVEDRNFWTANRLIERFNCLFSQIPSNSSSVSQWTPPLEQDPMQCHGEIHFARPPAERPAIYYRWRIYKTDSFGNSSDVNKTAFHPRPSRHFPTNDDTITGPAIVSESKNSFTSKVASAIGTAFGAAVNTAFGGNQPVTTALAKRFTGGSDAPSNTPSADGSPPSTTKTTSTKIPAKQYVDQSLTTDRETVPSTTPTSRTSNLSDRLTDSANEVPNPPKLWVKVTDAADQLAN